MTQPHATKVFPITTTAQVRAALLAREEIALLDVREEAPFAEAHPLFAASLPLSRLELEAWRRIPRRDTAIVVYDNGEGLAQTAAERLAGLGYSQVSLLEGGLSGWRAAGGELFRDVNVPSKAFGELVEAERHTPSLSAQEVQALLERQRHGEADVVVLDARRFDEYNTMAIPGGISVPGGELALRVRALAPDPKTQVIVNCAGRTRSIIGTQSLVNAGIPNPVSALRNGTIGWTLAGQALALGQTRRFSDGAAPSPAALAEAAKAARALADRARVGRARAEDVARWQAEAGRTTYCFDVRTPEEFEAGHLPGFTSAPGGQLVQETDVSAPVRGARIVLADGGEAGDGVRANMTASWLAQMGWPVFVRDGVAAADLSETGSVAAELPPVAEPRWVAPRQLAEWLAEAGKDDTVVLNVTPSASHLKQHIPGAWSAVRSELPALITRWPDARRFVLTCGSGLLARYAAADLVALKLDAEVRVLEGGNAGWVAAGLPTEAGEQRLASGRIDRYRRPYEGTDAPAAAMQAYLDWEFGLVAQLGRDGTHGFFVI
ncbi:sulfurtransferase [Rhodoferax koreense]|uniref:Sulfurtransferase n=1 Tax=Rhodoferax koreensis TaxID=1842727 RepID=A0A1P8JQN9_9BURK|nr:rhodanese-related sulfurtransferase [Rhodoferax koreense]APW36076.1 sulfurtransferase [Rhodoferax koreense]